MTEEQIIEGEASVKAVPNTKTSRGTLLLHSAQNGTMKNVEHVNSTPFNRKTSITKIIAEMKEADNTPILNATDIVDDNNSTNSIDNAAGKRKAYEVWVESRKKKKLDEANVDSSNPLKEDP